MTPPVISTNKSCDDCLQIVLINKEIASIKDILREIPSLITFKNKISAGIAILALFATITVGSLFVLMGLFKSEMRETVSKMDVTVSKMSDSINLMATTTAVSAKTLELSIYAAEKDRTETKERVNRLENKR